MKNYRRVFLPLAAATLGIVALSACQSNPPTANAPAESALIAATPSSNERMADSEPSKTPKPGNSCYVHLFDDDNFGDDNDIIYGPGKWSNLKNLPDAAESDWGGDADSLKVWISRPRIK